MSPVSFFFLSFVFGLVGFRSGGVLLLLYYLLMFNTIASLKSVWTSRFGRFCEGEISVCPIARVGGVNTSGFVRVDSASQRPGKSRRGLIFGQA